MKDTVFRKYDIRGKVGSDLDIQRMYDLGRALAYYFKERNPLIRTVAIGMDGRNHSLAIRQEISKAFMDSGLDVSFIGVCPSPALYFAMFTRPFDAGIMVTASHNPKEYNGLKLCLGKEMLWGEEVQKIKCYFKEGKKIESNRVGKYDESPIIEPYIDFLKDHFKHLIGMKLSAIVDCGNGAGGTVLPLLIEKMGWKNVTVLFEEVDGNYPNHEADPVVAENMSFVKQALKTVDAEVGIGLDGDADRMAAMTKEGQLISGDVLLAIYAEPLLKANPGSSIVFDIKASQGLAELVEQWGGKLIMSPSGHSIIKKNMDENDSVLAGELSCHFFFSDRYFGFDDALYAMMRLFEIMVASKQSLSQLVSVFPQKISSPEMRIKCSDKNKHHVIEDAKSLFIARDDVTVITIDGVRAIMDYGWGILRVSNTQPVLSLRIESDTQEGFKKVKEDFYKVLEPHFDQAFLKREFDDI